MGMLTINKEKNGGKLTVSLVGRVDVMTAPQFDEEVSGDLDGVTELVLNLAELGYMSSAGLRVLVGLQKTMTARKGKLTVCSPSSNILDILKATGLADYLDIQE